MEERRPERSGRRPASVGALSVLPVFLTLRDARAIVIGNGAAAVWKAELLAAAGAKVDVLSLDPEEDMTALVEGSERIRLIARAWAEEDLRGASIAVADATDDGEAKRLRDAAKAHGVPINVIDRPEFCDFQFGAIVERSPLVIGVSTAGAAPALAQAARARIEAVLPHGLRDWAARAAALRPALRARRLGSRVRRQFWAQFAARAFSGREKPPAVEALEALVDRAQDVAASKEGSVVLVGAGPGDPDLLTLKAVRALQSADVVLHDDLASPEVVAMARREAEKITVGKRGYKPSCTQEDISKLMINLAASGKRVVRLKGGDPCLFGRANEEITALEGAGIAVDVVPGVTSASAAAAALGKSLTERRLARRVQFVTAHAQNGRLPTDLNWSALIDSMATTAVYMGLRTLPELVERLLREGLDPQTPAAAIENASREQERTVRAPIGDLPTRVREAGLAGPTLLLYGAALA